MNCQASNESRHSFLTAHMCMISHTQPLHATSALGAPQAYRIWKPPGLLLDHGVVVPPPDDPLDGAVRRLGVRDGHASSLAAHRHLTAAQESRDGRRERAALGSGDASRPGEDRDKKR